MKTASTASAQVLNAESMFEKASRETGLKDFGDPEFLDAFRCLVSSVVKDQLFNPLGETAFAGEMHRTLINRLRFSEDLRQHPEILEEDVTDPVVIIGLPRTGTTKLQRMLAADPSAQRLEFWRYLNIAPFPATVLGSSEKQRDPRIDVAHQTVAAMGDMMPDYVSSHPFGAEEVDEESALQMYSLKCLVTTFTYPSPTFRDWMSRQTEESCYRYLKQALQYLQWQDGGKRGRPWVLKTPVHIGTIDLVLKNFPKALFVFPHRHPREVVPSLCRLMAGYWSVVLDAPFTDPKKIGEFVLGVWSDEIAKHMELRKQLGSRLQIMDVRYHDIHLNPMKVISRIFKQAGRELTPFQETAMLDWERTHPQHQGGKYSYQLSDYGLTSDAVNLAFRDYIREFVEVDAAGA